MSRDDILFNIGRRNALRARAKLPLLDVEAECRKQIAILDHAARFAAWEAQAEARATIRRELLVEHRRKTPDFPTGSMGRWLLEVEVSRAFSRL